MIAIIIGFVLIIAFACCKVSSDCSREEEHRDGEC